MRPPLPAARLRLCGERPRHLPAVRRKRVFGAECGRRNAPERTMFCRFRPRCWARRECCRPSPDDVVPVREVGKSPTFRLDGIRPDNGFADGLGLPTSGLNAIPRTVTALDVLLQGPTPGPAAKPPGRAFNQRCRHIRRLDQPSDQGQWTGRTSRVSAGRMTANSERLELIATSRETKQSYCGVG